MIWPHRGYEMLKAVHFGNAAHGLDHDSAQAFSLILRVNCDLDRRLDVGRDALLMALNSVDEDPIPTAFGEFGQGLVPVKREAVAHGCHAVRFGIEQGELILTEQVEQFVPIFFRHGVMQHEFRPGGICNIGGTVFIVGQVLGGDDFVRVGDHTVTVSFT